VVFNFITKETFFIIFAKVAVKDFSAAGIMKKTWQD
jgi:hypothetical protein